MPGNLPHDSDVTQITVSEKVDIQIVLRAVDTASEVTQKIGRQKCHHDLPISF